MKSFSAAAQVQGPHGVQVVASCAKQHTEISLVSDFAPSLSFWSLTPALHPEPLPQPPQQPVTYQPDKTYVAMIVSDGDNMQVPAPVSGA